MDQEESIAINGALQKDDEIRRNHKKRTKDCFLLFCEVVLQHEKELLSETLRSSQELLNEKQIPDKQRSNGIVDNNAAINFDTDRDIYKEESSEETESPGDSFNSVTCFCGKPFAGRPMIECSGCLTWLHMSCAKVKRKNIPEFYYCDGCKDNGFLSPSSNNVKLSSVSSGEEVIMDIPKNNYQQDAMNSKNTSSDGFIARNQNQNPTITKKNKIKKSKMIKRKLNSSLLMSTNDYNVKNNSSDTEYLSGVSLKRKLKKIHHKSNATTKKSQPKLTISNAYTSTVETTVPSLTEFSINHQVSTVNNIMYSKGDEDYGNSSVKLLKKIPILTNNNIYNNVSETHGIVSTATNADGINKRLKLL
ncbi:CLUMA_CG020977, isoform A [Clunio marinus]|uniref:CLUMA_CG020977, isoform A n=1 Tax=Clunio marinus TaxID=568069 RepID=A0A1J1J6V8_9DIPT|nr:CLUMA_CG020977, isoform A [Clunio marinus]